MKVKKMQKMNKNLKLILVKARRAKKSRTVRLMLLQQKLKRKD